MNDTDAVMTDDNYAMFTEENLVDKEPEEENVVFGTLEEKVE
jgi:hypothetical protein